MSSRISKTGKKSGSNKTSSASLANGPPSIERVVQAKLSGPAAALQKLGDPSEAVRDQAAQGVRGSGAPLSFLEQIQACFGQHDLTSVQEHVGGQAQKACESMGAQAYASGSDVAFKQAPSLHTAAHEAAHVVQQRNGVQLQDGVGQPGDDYEKQADAVADCVVQGKSAEHLLPGSAGGGSAGKVQKMAEPAVQMSPEHEQRVRGALAEGMYGAAMIAIGGLAPNEAQRILRELRPGGELHPTLENFREFPESIPGLMEGLRERAQEQMGNVSWRLNIVSAASAQGGSENLGAIDINWSVARGENNVLTCSSFTHQKNWNTQNVQCAVNVASGTSSSGLPKVTVLVEIGELGRSRSVTEGHELGAEGEYGRGGAGVAISANMSYQIQETRNFTGRTASLAISTQCAPGSDGELFCTPAMPSRTQVTANVGRYFGFQFQPRMALPQVLGAAAEIDSAIEESMGPSPI